MSVKLIKGNNSFIVEFRHPVLKDKNQQGIIIKREVGVNLPFAEQIVSNLYTLLNTPKLWGVQNIELVAQLYGEEVARLFFEKLTNDRIIELKLIELLDTVKGTKYDSSLTVVLEEALSVFHRIKREN